MRKEYTRSFGPHVMLWMAVVSVLCLTACTPMNKKIHPHRSYLLSITPPLPHEPCLSAHRLEVRSCKVAPPFDGRHLIYQRSEVEYEADPYHLFLVPPAEQITHLLRQWYRTEYASTPASLGTPEDHLYILESFVERLVTDFTHPDQPVASLRMFIRLSRRPAAERTRVILLQKTYQAEQSLPSRPTAEGIVMGLGECLQKILQQFDAEGRTLIQDSER